MSKQAMNQRRPARKRDVRYILLTMSLDVPELTQGVLSAKGALRARPISGHVAALRDRV